MTSVTKQCYGYNCGGCPLCEPSCFGNENNSDLYFNPEFKLINDEFEIIFENLKILNEVISGKMYLTVPTESFNHASCNCEQYISLGNQSIVYQVCTYNIIFTVTANTIEILLEPKIEM